MADIDAVKDAMFPLLERMFDGFNQVYMVDVLLVLVGPTGGILPNTSVCIRGSKCRQSWYGAYLPH
jgi:hypothetical protein